MKKNKYIILFNKKDEDLSLLKEEFIEPEKEIKENERLSGQRKIMGLYEKMDELNKEIEKLEEEKKERKEW